MLNRFPIHLIPHGVDTKAYQPLDRSHCRSLLGLPSDKKVLMFAALSMNLFNKGSDLLLKALERLPNKVKTETALLLFGNGGGTIAEVAGFQALDLGHISNDRLKAIAYSAADLFVSPTRAEAFGLVCLESMACGIPVVSFRVGGVPDLVRPGITGYLAEPENTEDLCTGIIQLLKDQPLYNYMRQKCREIVLEEYSSELNTQEYIDLYNSIL
jgi:glycosyltransferase involved in cell wall biosynthesis